MTEVLVLPKKNSGCDYHRLILPYKYLGVDVEANQKDKISTLLSKCKVVVFNRWTGYDIAHLLRQRKKHGFKIVCDLDDYWELYPRHILYKHWQSSNMRKNIMEAVFNSDMVTVTTARLADVVKKLNKNVEILPNALPFGHEQFTNNTRQPEDAKFVYASGSSHFWDLFMIKNLFAKVARESLKKDFKIALAGYNDSNEESKKLWDSMENIITANGKLSYERKKTMPLDSYMNLYNGATVAIAPLEDNYFNRFKSNLKVLEAGCKNIPIITSAVPPYSDEPKDMFVQAGSISDWYDAFKRFTKDRVAAVEEGYKLGEYVRSNFDLFEVNKKRKQILEYLCTL